jgi:hypothetical protein
MTHQTAAAARRKVQYLKRRRRIAEFHLAWRRTRHAFFQKSHLRAQARNAIPIRNLLCSATGLILVVSGIGGAAMGFVMGHSMLGVTGALVFIPVFTILFFFAVARFVLNGSLFDAQTFQHKVEEELLWIQKWQANVEAINKSIDDSPANTNQLMLPPKHIPITDCSASGSIIKHAVTPFITSGEWITPEYPENHQIYFSQFEVAGVSYHRTALQEWSKLKNVYLQLQPEPTNPHDSNAIMVHGCGDGVLSRKSFHIGYLPKEMAAHIVRKNSLQQLSPRLRMVNIQFHRVVMELTGPKGHKKAFFS